MHTYWLFIPFYRAPCGAFSPAASGCLCALGLPRDHYLLWLTRWDGVHFIDENFRALRLMILQRSAVRHPAAIPGVQPQISFKYSVSFFTKGPPRESAGANPNRDTVPGNRNTFSAQVNQVSTNCALRVSAKLLTTRELCGTIHSLVGECLRCVLQRPWGHIPLKGAMQLCRPCRCLNQYTGNQR